MRVGFRGVALIILLFQCEIASALEVTMKAHVTGLPQPTVSGETNLPDGTRLMITFDSPNNDYGAQSAAMVAGGNFHSEKFTMGGNDLPPDKYTVKINLAIRYDDYEVKAIIGDRNKNLKGPLMYPDPITFPGEKEYNDLHYKMTFEVRR